MPAGLDIDHKRRLNGTMSPYAQHLIVSTGRSDWTSRIEDERDTAVWGKFTSQVKALLGRGGEFHDVGATRSIESRSENDGLLESMCGVHQTSSLAD